MLFTVKLRFLVHKCLQLQLTWTYTVFYATADEADAYMFYRCFFLFFACSVRRKNTRQLFSGTAERIFMKLLPNDSRENGVCIAIPKWGLGPRLIFLGAKNYTLRTWWWCMASDWELVCWLWHCAATAVALKRHERVNAFNLVSC